MAFPAPSPVYLGPPDKHSGMGNKPISRIVIHSTVSPCEQGGARNIARYFRSSAARGSAHYVIDPGEVVQSAYDSVVAWHAPPNPHSLGLEMCEFPKATMLRWAKKNQRQMLARTARLTAQLCLAYGVPATFLTPADLRAGRRGITTHNNVSQAFGQSTHWDPGSWPRKKFMRMVRKEIARIKAGEKPEPKIDYWHPNPDNRRYRKTQGNTIERLKRDLRQAVDNARKVGNKSKERMLKAILASLRALPWWKQKKDAKR